jgi:hypothetical protein
MDCAAEWSVCASSSSIEKPMDTTASSFTLPKNAKRAAEAMIRKGIAPAVDYGIKLSDDGRFEIESGANSTPRLRRPASCEPRARIADSRIGTRKTITLRNEAEGLAAVHTRRACRCPKPVIITRSCP